MERLLELEPLDETHTKALSDRYHHHLWFAQITWKEHNLLGSIHRPDRPTNAPFRPIAIYLDNLRSAHNVGSILRTTEAFRLGSVYFGGYTPYIDNPKVQKTSMCSYDKVPCFKEVALTALPRPCIALETKEDAPSVMDYNFPESFTLMLGNEEYGLSDATMAIADQFVQIPLLGYKNSLNVASAYAVAAAAIQHSLTRIQK